MDIFELTRGQLAGAPYSESSSLQLTAEINSLTDAQVYPRSLVPYSDSIYCLVRKGQNKLLAVINRQSESSDLIVALHPKSVDTLSLLRERLPWLNPMPWGTHMTAGCGDRLGLATPGHLHALRLMQSKYPQKQMAPILAQQSIREMARTNRSPQSVMDDAAWGVFQEGWSSGFGSDADHLKTTDDIDVCVAAGFTFFTFDPGAHVVNTYTSDEYATLPWGELETTSSDVMSRYAARYDQETIQRAFVKYGKAIVHVARLYRHLKSRMGDSPFEVEVSVDETDQPTTHAEHAIIASELRRLDVVWVSLAPRFVGRFEKGVDYIGDLLRFSADCAGHAQIAREWGPYKLSIHSGSDKFSIYPIVAQYAGQLVHLKTAGTSYLEALRTVAGTDQQLFRDIYALACSRYAEDRKSYHVSADPSRAPSASTRSQDLPGILDQFDARQMLHVCFGSILASFGESIKTVLLNNEAMHYADLQTHFVRHLECFCR